MLFKNLFSDISLAFLERYPTPASAARLGEQRMASFLKKQGYSGRSKPAELVERLRVACGVKKLDRRSDRAVRRRADLQSDLARCSCPSSTGSSAGCSVCSSAVASMSAMSKPPSSATS